MLDTRRYEQDDAGWDTPARGLFICLLGQVRVLNAGREVRVRVGSKLEALLSVLALRPSHGASRESLLLALWPDTAASLANQSLNTTVYGLRQLLAGGRDDTPPVVYAHGTYRLNTEAGIEVDTARFDELIAAGERRAAAGAFEDAAARYRRAIELYRGDLCAGTDVQAVVERERLRASYLTLIARLAAFHFDRQEYSACLTLGLRLLVSDPCREDAHRLVMRCHVRLGERAQALRQFHLCRNVLREEFDVAPEPATQALYEQVRLYPDAV